MKASRHKIRGIDILYEDAAIIVVNKAEGILTEETRKGEAFTAEKAINNYIRKGQLRSSKRVWLVHRLDRDTSGILIFAKSEDFREKLAEVWHTDVVKTYLAAAWGFPQKEHDTLAGYLYEDKNLFVRQISVADAGKLSPDEFAKLKYAETEFTVIGKNREMSLLKINLHTGRRNQIRVQLAGIGHPLVGDKKYCPASMKFNGRMCLHAISIDFPHPATGKPMHFETEPPSVFRALFHADVKHPESVK